MNELETYKQYIRKHKLEEFKKEVLEIVSRRKLTSVMNDTKWIELQKAVEALLFPPPYIVKCVTDEDHSQEEVFNKIPHYIGDWSNYWEEGMPLFFNIEWIKVIPKHAKYRGRLIADEVLDETPAFIAILEKYNIPYIEENGIFTIYGYK